MNSSSVEVSGVSEILRYVNEQKQEKEHKEVLVGRLVFLGKSSN